MQRLTQEGLLVSIRNRGLFVIEMTDAEIRDMYVLREKAQGALGDRFDIRDPAIQIVADLEIGGLGLTERDQHSIPAPVHSIRSVAEDSFRLGWGRFAPT